MTWILIALIGHAFNGVAFIIDKILLKHAFKRSATYAGLVGLLSGLSFLLIPWVTAWPMGLDMVLAVVTGVTFMGALWSFFTALSKGEASRVVPVISAAIPMVTLVGTMLFLQERLTRMELIGFFLLIIATVLLAGGRTQHRMTRGALSFSILSAFLFAVTSVSGKALYDSIGFLDGFVTTRLIAAGTALLMVVLIDPLAGTEILSIFKGGSKAPKKTRRASDPFLVSPRMAAKLAILGQTLGGIGFVGVQYAISLGSASIVNALQVMQFALLVGAAFLFRKRSDQLLGECLNRSVIAIKAVALLIMALGLGLIVPL